MSIWFSVCCFSSFMVWIISWILSPAPVMPQAILSFLVGWLFSVMFITLSFCVEF